jgi:[FeFe] hydrogenase H-cluster maturation GTPase HydF
MRKTPKGLRLHIGLFGRRNAGKSSILNALTRQEVSIVSEVAGTTTDPVEKPMEMLPVGPVLFIDTAGVDDLGALGELRVRKTQQVFDRTDVGVIVVPQGDWSPFEETIVEQLTGRDIPVVVVFNKSDVDAPSEELLSALKKRNIPFLETIATQGKGIRDLHETIIRITPEEYFSPPSIVSDLIPPGELAVLVVPIDKEAPRGRLILPQVQTIRDLLDGDQYAMVVKERELRDALDRLKRPPGIVVTDSQAFLKVAADTPPEIKMTSFSILFARQKGDLMQMVQGAASIEHLDLNARILIAEACSHHPITEDIGRVKIPRWLRQFVGGDLDLTHVQGHDFPEDLSPWDLVIHCGACMWNRREMLTRLVRCREAGVPITNYGLAIAYSLGIFERALEPFPDALEGYRRILAQTQL